MNFMFDRSKFEGDISAWKRCSVSSDDKMFIESEIAKKLGIKNPSFNQVKSYFLGLKLELSLQGASPGQSNLGKIRL